MRRPRRHGRSPAEYFVAFLGLALVAFVAALVATSGSCRVGFSPDVGVKSSRPLPTPTPAP